MNISTLKNSIKYIRSNKDRFIKFPEKTAEELVSMIIFDACIGGAANIKYLHSPPWHIISASESWLSNNFFDLKENKLFDRIVPMPNAGRNMHRHEVIVAALSSSVILFSKNGAEIIVGAPTPEDLDNLDKISKEMAGLKTLAFCL